jgi:hypothetical protein
VVPQLVAASDNFPATSQRGIAGEQHEEKVRNNDPVFYVRGFMGPK